MPQKQPAATDRRTTTTTCWSCSGWWPCGRAHDSAPGSLHAGTREDRGPPLPLCAELRRLRQSGSGPVRPGALRQYGPDAGGGGGLSVSTGHHSRTWRRQPDSAAPRCAGYRGSYWGPEERAPGCRRNTEPGELNQSLRQLRKAEGGLSGMDTAQAGDPVENLGQ